MYLLYYHHIHNFKPWNFSFVLSTIRFKKFVTFMCIPVIFSFNFFKLSNTHTKNSSCADELLCTMYSRIIMICFLPSVYRLVPSVDSVSRRGHRTICQTGKWSTIGLNTLSILLHNVVILYIHIKQYEKKTKTNKHAGTFF